MDSTGCVPQDPLKHPGVHFPPPLIFLLGIGGGLLCNKWWPLPLLPPQWRAVEVVGGWASIAFWAAIAAWSMVLFARQGTAIYPNSPATKLVTWGPYRFSRNPMYVAFSVLYFGLSMMVSTAWPLLFQPIVWVLLYFFVIRREERYLASAFGAEYEAYRARVRRWL